jgi:hypothetical protein
VAAVGPGMACRNPANAAGGPGPGPGRGSDAAAAVPVLPPVSYYLPLTPLARVIIP